jgi:serine/threonine protein phosphatase 1
MMKFFDINLVGRDFVIGDLHGCYELLQQLLQHLQFDHDRDRMFSVGDLVDRGPNSYECLQLIDEPWFHPVLSNHEKMMVDAFNGNYLGNFWSLNGGSWGMEALRDWREREQKPPLEKTLNMKRLVDKAANLPMLISVKRKNGSLLHILHAELHIDSPLIDEDLLTMSDKFLAAALSITDNGEMILWGRDLFYDFYSSNLGNIDEIRRAIQYKAHKIKLFNPQLSHIISGHTPVQKPFTILGQTNIDTGAFLCYCPKKVSWSGLTCADMNEWKFYRSRPGEVIEVSPVVV